MPHVLRRRGRAAATPVPAAAAAAAAAAAPPAAAAAPPAAAEATGTEPVWARTRKCGEDGGVRALADRAVTAAGTEYTTLSGVVGGDI